MFINLRKAQPAIKIHRDREEFLADVINRYSLVLIPMKLWVIATREESVAAWWGTMLDLHYPLTDCI